MAGGGFTGRSFPLASMGECSLRRLEPGSGIVSQVGDLCRKGSLRTAYIPEWEDARMGVQDAGCRVQDAGCGNTGLTLSGSRASGRGTSEKVAG